MTKQIPFLSSPAEPHDITAIRRNDAHARDGTASFELEPAEAELTGPTWAVGSVPR